MWKTRSSLNFEIFRQGLGLEKRILFLETSKFLEILIFPTT